MSTEIQVALAEQNRWKTNPGKEIYPSELRRERHIVRHLVSCLFANTPVRYHILLGPRQSGKTTAMKQTMLAVSQRVPAESVFYIEADHPVLKRVSLEDIVKIVEEMHKPSAKQPLFLFIDEIGKSSEWNEWLKSWHGNKRHYRVLASSSNALNLHRGESGPGRWEEHLMLPMNFLEYTEFQPQQGSSDLVPKWCRTKYPTLSDRLRDIPPAPHIDSESEHRLLSLLLLGGYPEIQARVLSHDPENVREAARSAQKLLESIANTVVLRDIAETSQIRNIAGLGETFEAVGAMIGKEGTTGTICEGVAGVGNQTVGEYMQCLERVNLIFRLRQFSEKTTGTGKTNKKFYFWDTALAAAIGKRGDLIARDSTELGHAKENVAAACLMELAERERKRLQYWRKNGRVEVDFIYDGVGKGEALAIEIGSNKESKMNLNRLLQAKPKFHGNAYLVTDKPAIVNAAHTGIGELPLTLFLMAVSAQSIQAALEHGTSKQPANHRVLKRTNGLFPVSAHETTGEPSYNQPSFKDGDIVMLTHLESQEAAELGLAEKC